MGTGEHRCVRWQPQSSDHIWSKCRCCQHWSSHRVSRICRCVNKVLLLPAPACIPFVPSPVVRNGVVYQCLYSCCVIQGVVNCNSVSFHCIASFTRYPFRVLPLHGIKKCTLKHIISLCVIWLKNFTCGVAGLFHAAIEESGTDTNFWSYARPASNPWNYTLQVAEKCGCPTEPPADMYACMQAIEDPFFIHENQRVDCTVSNEVTLYVIVPHGLSY